MKRILVCLFALFSFLLGVKSVAIGGEPVTIEANWKISIEQEQTSLYKKYASSSSLMYLLSDVQQQVLSIQCVQDYPYRVNMPFFFKKVSSTTLDIRVGRANNRFDYDYGENHERFSVNDNAVYGYGVEVLFDWNEYWSTNMRGIIDYGFIDNKSISWEATRSGYVYAEKVKGDWKSVTADIETKYNNENDNIQYLLGIEGVTSSNNITHSDYPGYPATTESTDAFLVVQAYLYTGCVIYFLDKFSLLARVGYPLGKSSGLGYMVKIDYGF